MRKSRGMFLAVLILMLVTTGCSSLVGGKWVAKVNGESILVKDFDARVSQTQKNYANQGIKFDTEEGQAVLAQIKSQILSLMIQDKIFAQEVRNQKLNTEDEKVKEQLEIIKVKNQIKDDTELQEALKNEGTTLTEFKNYLTLYLKVTSDVQVPDETEAKTFFDKNINYYNQPESVKAHHILVGTEEEAKAIIKQLEAASKKEAAILPLFKQLAKDKSTEPGAKESSGDLGTFTKGQMVPEFEEAAFAQKVGTFSPTPVKTEFGYHIIFVEAHTSALPADFAKLKDQVVQDALAEAKDEKFMAFFEDLKKKTVIEYAKGYEPVG
ncbi:MAG: peptidylprolyl isomerase [Desulfosporosinus sp.]|jgi:parvulin-like peptidyl-prolyl isomerase